MHFSSSSFWTNIVFHLKINQIKKIADCMQEMALRTISLRTLNAMLVESEALGLVGPTVLLLIYPEDQKDDGKGSPGSGSSVKTRHIFLRGFDCQQGQVGHQYSLESANLVLQLYAYVKLWLTFLVISFTWH